MSAHEELSTAASKPNAAERISEFSSEISPELIEKRIKENLAPLHAQISAQTELLDKLIQVNSARVYTMASTRERRFSSESPLTDKVRHERTLPLAPLIAAGYSPDPMLCQAHFSCNF